MTEPPDRGGYSFTGDGLALGTSRPSQLATVAPSADPKEALKQAADAITRLEESASKGREASRWATAAVVAVCALALAAIVVHTFYEKEAPKVDETSALLLAVLLFAPFVRYLRALEFAGAKAEFEDHASDGLRAVVKAVRAEHEAILRLFDHLLAQTAPEAEMPLAVQPTPTETPAPPVGETSPAQRPLRRILWVDDNPERNAYEVGALRKLFEIATARTTQEAESLLRTGAFDAVISDIVRIEDGQPNYQAAQRVGAIVAAMEPPLPVFFYASEQAVRTQAQALMDAGATVVTASYVELVRAIRRQARANFDAAVRKALHGLPDVQGVAEQVDDIDFIITLRDGRQFAVETPHWLAPPEVGAVQARYDKLSKAIAERQLDGALLVTQRDLLAPEQKRRAPTNVQLVVRDQLPARLAELVARPDANRPGSPTKA
jgi:CheY-like chemotaxis protein